MNKDINCLNFKGLFGYVEHRLGKAALDKLIQGALGNRSYLIPNKNNPGELEPVTLDHLRDESYWISNELSLSLLGMIKAVVPGPEPEFTAGRGAVLENLSSRDLFFAKVLGPKALAKRAARVNRKFNRTKDVRVTRFSRTRAAVELCYKPGFKVTKDVCNWNLGIYAGILEASGARVISITETRCVLDGDACCEIDVRMRLPGLLKRIYTYILSLFTRDLVNEYEKTAADRDRLIDQLKESEHQYRLLVENQSDLVVKFNTRHQLQFVSSSYCRMYDRDRRDLLSTSFLDHVLADDQAAMTEAVERICAPPFAGRIQVRTKTPKGIRWISWSGTAVRDENGRVTAVTALGRDVTELKKARDQREQALTMAAEAKKLALVGQISGKMAHDFNNILGIIMGLSELAIQDCRDKEIKSQLELILNQTLRGKNLTRNLVAFAKSQEPNQAFFKLNEKIDLVLSLMKKDLAPIRLTLDQAPGIPDVMADPGMIEHTLVNLLQNAVHAVSRTQTPEITIRTRATAESICLEVEDNGCGIPESSLDSIFDPAFTLKGSRDLTGAYEKDIKGTGYGMANVKKYIDLHQGNIRVNSRVNHGTAFVISLPRIEKELSEAEKTTLTEQPFFSKKYILLVEDEPSIADVQYRILTRPPLRHRVDTATNARVAMDLLERNAYDLVSLDYLLPGKMTGMDVYTHLRQLSPACPVIFISGNIEFLESLGDLTQKDPYLAHIPKPCRNLEYISAVNQLLHRAEDAAPLPFPAAPGTEGRKSG